MAQAYNLLMSEGGARRICKGLYPTLLRGYIVNMITLPLYDAIKDQLDGREGAQPPCP